MKDEAATTKIAYAVYILYLVSFLFPVLPILAVVLAYIFENDAQGYLKSHYQYLIRSFWILLLYSIISVITIFVLIGILLGFLCALWWIIRLVKGLKSLMNKEPIPNPKVWLF